MRTPRGLSAEEAALWARVASTVRPLQGRKVFAVPNKDPICKAAGENERPAKAIERTADHVIPAKRADRQNPAPVRALDHGGLDASWERKLANAAVQPDFTLDLHGHTLDAAHVRLEHGLALATAQGARLVLVITGRPRPADAADRGSRRGAIRAKLIDWLAAGSHASRIAAIRPAHQRHGGAGAVYIVLRRAR